MKRPPVRVVRHESVLGRWEMVRGAPHPLLTGLVRGYAGFVEHGPRRLRRREVAQEQVTLILNFGPPLRVGGPTEPTAERGSFVAAITDTYAITEHDGVSHGLQVDFSPLGAHMLLGLPMHELSALVIPLEEVLGREAPRLVEALAEAPGWPARFEMLDRFVLTRVEAARRPSPDVAFAWSRLVETSGRIPIASLASELGCSRRHLVGRFREQVGPAPKTAARIMRFAGAVRQLGLDDGSRFAEIAGDCGYYDQPHLNRDFRELAGTTPSEFVASRLPDGFGFAADP